MSCQPSSLPFENKDAQRLRSWRGCSGFSRLRSSEVRTDMTPTCQHTLFVVVDGEEEVAIIVICKKIDQTLHVITGKKQNNAARSGKRSNRKKKKKNKNNKKNQNQHQDQFQKHLLKKQKQNEQKKKQKQNDKERMQKSEIIITSNSRNNKAHNQFL